MPVSSSRLLPAPFSSVLLISCKYVIELFPHNTSVLFKAVLAVITNQSLAIQQCNAEKVIIVYPVAVCVSMYINVINAVNTYDDQIQNCNDLPSSQTKSGLAPQQFSNSNSYMLSLILTTTFNTLFFKSTQGKTWQCQIHSDKSVLFLLSFVVDDIIWTYQKHLHKMWKLNG